MLTWRVQKIADLVQASYKIRKAHSGPCDILPLQLILHFSFMSFVFKRQAFVSSFSNLCCIVWFSAASAGKAAETKTNDILAMISPEGERVGLTKVKNNISFLSLFPYIIVGLVVVTVKSFPSEVIENLIIFFFYLFKGLKARGNVEDWLGKVEESMVSSLRKLAKASIADYESRPREEWVTLHPSQVNSTLYWVNN